MTLQLNLTPMLGQGEGSTNEVSTGEVNQGITRTLPACADLLPLRL